MPEPEETSHESADYREMKEVEAALEPKETKADMNSTGGQEETKSSEVLPPDQEEIKNGLVAPDNGDKKERKFSGPRYDYKHYVGS